MQQNWVEYDNAFLSYMLSTQRQRVKMSMVEGEILVAKFDESLLPKFKTETEKDAYLN